MTQSQSQGSGPIQGEWPHQEPERPELEVDESLPAHAMPAMAVANAREEQRQQRIAELAYQLSEQNGFPEGMELEHWLEAERRLAGS